MKKEDFGMKMTPSTGELLDFLADLSRARNRFREIVDGFGWEEKEAEKNFNSVDEQLQQAEVEAGCVLETLVRSHIEASGGKEF